MLEYKKINVWSGRGTICATETRTLIQSERRRLKAFPKKVTNEEVLNRVNDDRQIPNSVWQRKHRWIGHVLRHDGLLHEITDERMKGKPTRGRRRIQLLHDFANDGGFVALKRGAKDQRTETQRKDVKNLLYSINTRREKTTDNEGDDESAFTAY